MTNHRLDHCPSLYPAERALCVPLRTLARLKLSAITAPTEVDIKQNPSTDSQRSPTILKILINPANPDSDNASICS